MKRGGKRKEYTGACRKTKSLPCKLLGKIELIWSAYADVFTNNNFTGVLGPREATHHITHGMSSLGYRENSARCTFFCIVMKYLFFFFLWARVSGLATPGKDGRIRGKIKKVTRVLWRLLLCLCERRGGQGENIITTMTLVRPTGWRGFR